MKKYIATLVILVVVVIFLSLVYSIDNTNYEYYSQSYEPTPYNPSIPDTTNYQYYMESHEPTPYNK